MEAELRIRMILESPTQLSDKIHVLLEEAKLHINDQEVLVTYFRFFFNAGYHQELLSLIVEVLERKAKVPWSLLIDCLGKNAIKLSQSVIQSIDKGLRRQNAQSEVWSARTLDSDFPEFSVWRDTFIRERLNALKVRRSELLEKFEFLRSQRLENEARQVLRVLKSTYPGDSEIENLNANFEEHRAREILNDYAHSLEDTKTYTPKFLESELDFLTLLRENAFELIQHKPQYRKDFCLFFLFLEDSDSALEILNQDDHLNFSEAWLKADLLRNSRRFLEALALADWISEQFSNDTETLMATTYFRAEVFGEMGKNSKAIELLENIAQVRPQYRSTLHLIQRFRSRGQP